MVWNGCDFENYLETKYKGLYDVTAVKFDVSQNYDPLTYYAGTISGFQESDKVLTNLAEQSYDDVDSVLTNTFSTGVLGVSGYLDGYSLNFVSTDKLWWKATGAFVSGETFCLEFICRWPVVTSLTLALYRINTSSPLGSVVVDLNDLSLSGNNSASVEDLGNGWARITYLFKETLLSNYNGSDYYFYVKTNSDVVVQYMPFRMWQVDHIPMYADVSEVVPVRDYVGQNLVLKPGEVFIGYQGKRIN